MIKKQFHCPMCKGTHLEEVVIDATVYNEVTGLDEDGYIEYGYCGDIEGGTVLQYQCAGCGYKIQGITSPEELAEYIEIHGK